MSLMSQSTSYPGALPPPTGVIPNIHAPWTHLQYTYITAFVIAAIFPTVFGALRLYAKAFILKQWAWADVIFFLSWALFICDLSLCASNVNNGVYQHAWNISPKMFVKLQGRVNIIQVVYVATNTLCKVAIMIQLADIFVPNKPHRRWTVLLSLVTFTVGFYTIIFFIELFWCSPPSKVWNPDIPGKCIDNSTIYIATSIVNVFDDFAILTLPMVWTLKLHIPTKQKLKVIAVFAVGLFACICSLIRLIYSVRLLRTTDLSWTIAPVAMWAMAEISAGLVVATMPYIPLLVKKAKKDHATKLSNLESDGSAASGNVHGLQHEKKSFQPTVQHRGSLSVSSLSRSVQAQDLECQGEPTSPREDLDKKSRQTAITKSISVEQYTVPISWNDGGAGLARYDFPHYERSPH